MTSINLYPEATALAVAFAFGWWGRNLLHRLLDRKMHGLLSLTAQLCTQLAPNEGDLELMARLLRVLGWHAAWTQPGWCPPVRQEVRDFLTRLATVHDCRFSRDPARGGAHHLTS